MAKDVNVLVAMIEEMGNPLLEDSMDLLILDNKDILPESVVGSVKNTYQIGKLQYDKYKQQILKDCIKPNTDTIHKNNLPLFRNPFEKEGSPETGT